VVHRRADWVPIVDMLKKSKKRLINWFPGFPLPTDGLFPRARQGYRNIVNMFFNPDPEKRLRLIPIESKSQICSILGMLLTWIIKGAITLATLVIVWPVVPGEDCQGCTVGRTVITVDPSTVFRLYQQVDIVRVPGPTTQSAAAVLPTPHAATHTTSGTVTSVYPHSVGPLPMTQGLYVSSSDQLPPSFDFAMDPRTFAPADLSDPFSLPPSGFPAPGTAARLYESDAQSLPFNPYATLGSTSSTFIHPSSGGMIGPHHAGTDWAQKRKYPPPPVQEERFKCRKLEGRFKRVVDQQVGYQGPTTAIGPTVPLALFDRPPGMSREDYVKMLQNRIAAESGAPALD